MINTHKENVTIAWCDNGNSDGKFTEGLVYTLLNAQNCNIKIGGAVRVSGNQIARQRQVLFDQWADNIKSDWLLWIDSDIVLTMDSLQRLLNTADKNNKKIVSGIYFISDQPESSLMKPMPAVYYFINNMKNIKTVENLPHDTVIKIDGAGMGLIIMHKSIIKPLRKITEDNFIFAEINSRKNFTGEDVSFFRNVKNAGIQAYAHTGAFADHIKRFNFNVEYHNFYWKNKNIIKN